jgi:hypothetical protein
MTRRYRRGRCVATGKGPRALMARIIGWELSVRRRPRSRRRRPLVRGARVFPSAERLHFIGKSDRCPGDLGRSYDGFRASSVRSIANENGMVFGIMKSPAAASLLRQQLTCTYAARTGEVRRYSLGSVTGRGVHQTSARTSSCRRPNMFRGSHIPLIRTGDGCDAILPLLGRSFGLRSKKKGRSWGSS